MDMYKLLCVIFVITFCNSSPIFENSLKGLKTKRLKANSSLKNAQAPNDLENLLKKFTSHNVHEEKVSVLSNIDGGLKENELALKQVTNKENGKLVSDLKQTVSKTKNNNKPAETHVKTKVDVPQLGIHKVFEQDDEQPLNLRQNDLFDNKINFESPSKLASFLYSTDSFTDFDQTLEDLVAKNLITSSEAQSYYDMVLDEYSKLQAQDADENDSYLSEYPIDDRMSSYPLDDSSNDDSYDPYIQNIKQKRLLRASLFDLFPWLTDDKSDEDEYTGYYRQYNFPNSMNFKLKPKTQVKQRTTTNTTPESKSEQGTTKSHSDNNKKITNTH